MFMIIGGWFVFIGIALVCFSFLRLLEAKASMQWPTVEGRVMDAEVVQLKDSTNRQTTAHFFPRVHYEYTIGNERFESERIWTIQSSQRSHASASGIISQFNQGASVTVYYNPEQKDRAVLIPGAQSRPWLFLVVGGVMLCLGTAVILAKYCF